MNRHKIVLNSLIIFLAVVFSTGELKAQDNNRSGYIITKSNDTIKGYILNVNIGQFTKCLFQKDSHMKPVEYSPEDIIAYRFDNGGKFFVSKEVPSGTGKTTLFLEYLIKGKANLYFMRDNTEHYYIQKENELLIELTEPKMIAADFGGEVYSHPQKYTGRLKYILSDCPAVFPEIDAVKLYPDQLIRLAKDYHNQVCDSAKCIIYERKLHPVKINLGVFAGVSYNDFKFNTANFTDKRAVGFAGCVVEIENLFFSLERITLNTGLAAQYLTTYTFNTDNYISQNVVFMKKQVSDMNMKAFTIKIPVMINYIFTQTRLRPYLGGGITNMFFLTQNKDIYITDYNEYYGQPVPLYHLGIVGTAGLKYKLKDAHSVFAEFSYEKIQNMNMNEILRMHNKTISFRAGYLF